MTKTSNETTQELTPGGATATKPLRVLLVEDNPADADLVRHAVKGVPVAADLEVTERLAEALEWLGKRDYSVIVTDLHLPDSQGLDTFHRLHARRPEIPIIVMTSLGDEGAAVRALRGGAQDYLVKGTLDAKRVQGSFRFAIERQQMMNEVIASMSRREKLESALLRCASAHLWGAMFGVLGEGATAILYKAGTAAGSTTFDFLQATYPIPDDAAFVHALTEHFGLVGLFLVEEMRIDRNGKRVDVRLRKNFETKIPNRESKGPSCHFIRGLLSGVSARLLGLSDLTGKETACEREGADACTFAIQPMFT